MNEEVAAGVPLFVSNPEQWLKETVSGPDLCCIIIFRGSWCPYDKYYLQKLGRFMSERDGTVKLIAWTSEGADGANKAAAEWDLLSPRFGFDQVIGDDTNALAKYLIEDEILPNLVTLSIEEAKLTDKVPVGAYPNGIVMPGQVWYAHHGMITEQWECSGDAPHFGGGCGRPDPVPLWTELLKRKATLNAGNAVMPHHDNAHIQLIATSTDLDFMKSQCSVL